MDELIYFVRVDENGLVRSNGHVTPDDSGKATLSQNGVYEVSKEEWSNLQTLDPIVHYYRDSVISSAQPQVDLDDARHTAISRINGEAEARRSRYMTAGIGQSAEYSMVLSEAKLLRSLDNAAINSTDFPFLMAQCEASTDSGVPLKLPEAAEIVIKKNVAWVNALASIRKTRLAAKFRVSQATTAQEVGLALSQTVWLD